MQHTRHYTTCQTSIAVPVHILNVWIVDQTAWILVSAYSRGSCCKLSQGKARANKEGAPDRVTSSSFKEAAEAAAAPFLKDSASRSAVPTPLSRLWPWLTLSSLGASDASDVSLSLLQHPVDPRYRARMTFQRGTTTCLVSQHA